MTRSMSASLSPFAVFRNRNFSLLWTGQLVSTMGSALSSLAASIYVFRLTGSALSVGLMLMATAAQDKQSSRSLQQVSYAAERAAALTRQLLTFSRRQVMQPQVLNLNRVTADLEKMRLVQYMLVESHTRLVAGESS